jgi:hypothetical protein
MIDDTKSSFINRYEGFSNGTTMNTNTEYGTLMLHEISPVSMYTTQSPFTTRAQSTTKGPSPVKSSGKSSVNTGFDTVFHDTIEDIKLQSNAYFPQTKTIDVKDSNENPIKIEVPKDGAGFTYYQPGSYKHSASSYVPDYEDGVALSKSIGLVPRLKGDLFIPSEPRVFNSSETNYNSANSVFNSSNWSALTTTVPDSRTTTLSRQQFINPF